MTRSSLSRRQYIRNAPPKSRQPQTLEDLLQMVFVCFSGCWFWLGGTSGDTGRGAGYGRILRPGTRRVMPAHRYVFQTFVGPIPPGFHVDHLCRMWSLIPMITRLCVNPHHLEAITPEENMRRRDQAAARQLWHEDLREISERRELPADTAVPLCAPGEADPLADFA